MELKYVSKNIFAVAAASTVITDGEGMIGYSLIGESFLSASQSHSDTTLVVSRTLPA
jgi:hypothetical protein